MYGRVWRPLHFHTAHNDVPLHDYIEHVSMTHKHTYISQSQILRF